MQQYANISRHIVNESMVNAFSIINYLFHNPLARSLMINKYCIGCKMLQRNRHVQVAIIIPLIPILNPLENNMQSGMFNTAIITAQIV